MGAKHASVHIRCDDSKEVIAKLKKNFNKKPKPDENNLMIMNMIKQFAQHNIDIETVEVEKAKKQSALDEILRNYTNETSEEESAVIVIREHFVSIYWYDKIRCDNVTNEMWEYSHKCNAPVLAVSVYDGTNFSIFAISNAGNDLERTAQGLYMFDYEDIQPVDAEKLCNIINAPFLLKALEETLSCEEGSIMANTFEKATDMHILMYDELCEQLGYSVLHKWKSATVHIANIASVIGNE